jgi:hypothetical protein
MHAMGAYITQNPSTNMARTLFCFVDLLAKVQVAAPLAPAASPLLLQLAKKHLFQHAINALAYLLPMCATIVRAAPEGDSLVCCETAHALSTTPQVHASAWRSLRQHFEANCLMWLSHYDPFVRPSSPAPRSPLPRSAGKCAMSCGCSMCRSSVRWSPRTRLSWPTT